MKILCISNRASINKSEALTWFKPYCEEPNLRLETDLNSAKEFLTEQILKCQKHLDFIITDWDFHHQNAKELLNWKRESNATYSANNFQFTSLPILLIEDISRQSSFISEGFDGVVRDFPTNYLNLKLAIKSSVKSWRYSLADDLDLIGLDPKTQIIYSNHRSSFISYYKLKVLSRLFVDNKSKQLDYIWTNPPIKRLNDSNDEFLHKMNRTIRNPPKYLEKEFHKYFLENPTFIKGEDFITRPEEMLYEKHLYKNGKRKYDEPDFINKPYEYTLRSPGIFEIKRQSQKIIRYERQKQRFISKARKAFEQVKRYKVYMTSTDPQNQFYIQKYLGKIYPFYEYTLLMGSKYEKQEYEDLIGQLKSDFDFNDINLLTYEELLDSHVRLCNELEEFNIF